MLLNAGNLLPPAPDLAGERNVTEIRLTLGYGHPNTFGGLAFGLGLGYTMRRAARPRWGRLRRVLAVLGVLIWAGAGLPHGGAGLPGAGSRARLLPACAPGAAIPRAAARVYAAAVPALAAGELSFTARDVQKRARAGRILGRRGSPRSTTF